MKELRKMTNRQVRQAFGTPFGDEFARGGGLFKHAFESGGWPGGECLSCSDVVRKGQAAFHRGMMRKIW